MTLSRFDELYIDGQFIAPVRGGRIESVDPSTGEVWATVGAAGAADVDRAVAAADRAFRSPDWRGLTAAQRGRLLARLADLLERDLDELAAIESRDNGKPISNARMDVANAAVWFRYYAGAADKLSGEQLPIAETTYAYTVRVPLGVVAAIIPWNSPLPIMSWKLAPALAAGNTVVLKPSELAGASCLKAAALFTEAGFPAGVVNILPGYGEPAGVALISHPLVAKISFTGSDRTGQAVGQVAARRFVPITAECGGKAPFVVFSDADIDEAVEKAVGGMFVNAGQQCTVASRVLVQQDRYEEFVAAYVARVSALRVGDPADPATEVGAIVSAGQLERIEGFLKLAHDEGVRILLGGNTLTPADERLRGGYFVEPTVLADVSVDSALYQDEIFGPVVILASFSNEDEAVRLANGVRYGLVAGVFTSDARRAHRVAARLDAGLIWLNTYRQLHPSLPYGGFKMSGLGRENGLEALRAYTEVKSIVVEVGGGG
jgi:aldehyde dehydrogenase (NAD+)